MGFRNPAVWMILILLIVLLFGASRLPDITRNIGKSLKIFKEEVSDLGNDTPKPPIEQAPPAPPAQPESPTTQASTAEPGSDNPPQAPHPGN